MGVDLLRTGPSEAAATLLLAHGAGAPMDSPWMEQLAAALALHGIRTARFEFEYMASRRSGTRRPPPRGESLTAEYLAAVAAVRSVEPGRLLIGGKSLGGRVASLVADELLDSGDMHGLVCLGYPFHPPGRPEKTRTAHLEHLRTPTLVCQGERDPFGTPVDVAGYRLSPAITVRWFADGDHGLAPRKRVSGLTLADHLDAVARAVHEFAEGLPEPI